MRLQRRLTLLVISLLIPAVLACGFAAYYTYVGERSNAEQNVLRTSRAVAIAVDRELARLEHTLRVLATSPSLTTGDLAAFWHQATEATQEEGVTVVLNEPSGQQLLNTLRPPGTPLPMSAAPESIRRVVETGRPQVSDLFFGPVAKRHVFAIEVPVVRNGKVVYVLSMGVWADVLGRILKDQGLPQPWVAAIFDRKGVTVARTRDPHRFIGRPATSELLARLNEGGEGIIETVTLEGIPVVTAYSQSPVYRWSFAIGVPQAEVQSSVRRSIAAVLGVGLALVAIGMALSIVFAGSISRAISTLSSRAVAIGHGKPIETSPSGLREIDDVQAALQEASALLQQRSAERDRAEAALTQSKEGLAALVSERTRELERANQRLRGEIAERQRTEEQLRQAQKMQAIGELSGGLAHDFNNVLQTVSSALHVLKMRTQDANFLDLVEMALRSVRRGAGLTQQLLTFSRKQQLTPTPIDLNRSITGMTDVLKRTLGGTIAVVNSLYHDLWPALADAQQIELAILNLALNARDAMPYGGTLNISTSNTRFDDSNAPHGLQPGDYVRLAIRDTGCGMTPDILARAFEPFFTTKTVGKGTGLGLSVVYGLARQLGGDVRLDSHPGAGTTVSVYLRRAEEAPAEAPDDDERGSNGEAPAKLDLADPGAKGPFTVLVVDDDALVRATTAQMVRELGAEVLESASGADAMALLDHHTVHLVLTDYAMPGMTGLDLMSRVQAARPGLPVVLMTGYANASDVQERTSAPILKKPFEPGDVARVLKRTLKRA